MECDGKADAVSCKDKYYAGLDKRDLARLLEDLLLLGNIDCPALKKVTRQTSNTCAQVDSVAGKVGIIKLHLNCKFLGLGTLPCHWHVIVQNQLQIYHKDAHLQQSAECNCRQAWELSASLLSVTSSGDTMQTTTCTCIYSSPHNLNSEHTSI